MRLAVTLYATQVSFTFHKQMLQKPHTGQLDIVGIGHNLFYMDTDAVHRHTIGASVQCVP